MSEHDEVDAATARRLAEDDAIYAALEPLAGGVLTDWPDVREARRIYNLGPALRVGSVPPPTMLLPRWLVSGELHWVYAEAEAAKTWLALEWAVEVMKLAYPEEDGTHRPCCVVWFDEELGQGRLVERLYCLGADPDLVEQRFVYLPFPSWTTDPDSVTAHHELIQRVRPALVVYDTATDMLAEAELDENSGPDVTKWVKLFPEQARQLGATQVVLDHTTKAEGSTRYAVGSRAKRAKAKVAYHLAQRRADRFDRSTVGKVTVELTKNTPGAEIPIKRSFRVGGGEGAYGGFLWQEQELPDHPGDDDQQPTDLVLRDRILKAVQQAGEISTKKLEDAVGGRAKVVRDTAAALAGMGLLEQEVGGPGKATTYRLPRTASP